MTEEELYNEYRKSDCKSFMDFLINKITELKKTYRKQRNKRIDDLQKENAELKEELKKWKEEWQEQVQKENDESYARTLQTIQLTKAKEIIKTLAADLSMYSGNYQKELLEAKQFLSEVEK